MSDVVNKEKIIEALTDVKDLLKEIRELLHSPLQLLEVSAAKENILSEDMFRSELTKEETVALLDYPLHEQDEDNEEPEEFEDKITKS